MLQPVSSSAAYILGHIVDMHQQAAQPLVRLFYHHDKLVPLICALADREMKQTTWAFCNRWCPFLFSFTFVPFCPWWNAAITYLSLFFSLWRNYVYFVFLSWTGGVVAYWLCCSVCLLSICLSFSVTLSLSFSPSQTRSLSLSPQPFVQLIQSSLSKQQRIHNRNQRHSISSINDLLVVDSWLLQDHYYHLFSSMLEMNDEFMSLFQRPQHSVPR